MVISKSKMDGMDAEWFALILEAKKMGLSMEAVREFLNQNETSEIFVEQR